MVAALMETFGIYGGHGDRLSHSNRDGTRVIGSLRTGGSVSLVVVPAPPAVQRAFTPAGVADLIFADVGA